jgi:hypothetical protein
MYCLYIIFHVGIIGLNIFSKPSLSPGFGLSHVVSAAQAQFKPTGGLGWARFKWARLAWALGPAQHITRKDVMCRICINNTFSRLYRDCRISQKF